MSVKKDMVIQAYRDFSAHSRCWDRMKRRTGVSVDEAKSIVNEYLASKGEKPVTYQVMRRKKHGLRLVRVHVGADKMDWYTDRDDDGIEEYVETLRKRIREGAAV